MKQTGNFVSFTVLLLIIYTFLSAPSITSVTTVFSHFLPTCVPTEHEYNPSINVVQLQDAAYIACGKSYIERKFDLQKCEEVAKW